MQNFYRAIITLFLFSLIGNCLHFCIDLILVSEIVVPCYIEVFIKLVDQRNSCRNIDSDNIIV